MSTYSKLILAVVFVFYLTAVVFAADRELDVVLVIDFTGSMGGNIDAVKSNLEKVATELSVRSFDPRFAALSVSDRSPYERHLPFTSDIAQVITWLRDHPIVDGGDQRENPLDPMMHALASEFRTDAEVAILLITDNPPHEAGDGTSITQMSISKVAEKYASMNRNRVRTFYSSPSDVYSAFAISLGWPFSGETLLYSWIGRLQGIELPLDGTPAEYLRWRQALASEPALLYEDWALLKTLQASRLAEGLLNFDFLTNNNPGLPLPWNDFFTRYGSEGRRLLQRAMQMDYRLHQKDYLVINRWWSVDSELRRIEFENATGLYSALKSAVEKEKLSEEEWLMLDEIFRERLLTLSSVNPRLLLSDVFANRESYSAMSPEVLRKDAKAYRNEMDVYDALDDETLDMLNEVEQKGWQIEVRDQFFDWELDDKQKIIYISEDEYIPSDAPAQFRQALNEANSRLTEKELLQAYIEKYKEDSQALHYLNLVAYSDYELHLEKFRVYDSDVDEEGRRITIDSGLDLEEAVSELHEALNDVFGSLASRILEGAGKNISTLGLLAKLDDRTLAELGATEIVRQYRSDLANGVAVAGSVQELFLESMAWEGGAFLVGAAIARAPEFVNVLRARKRLQPNQVTHFRHKRISRKGKAAWVETPAAADVEREIDNLTDLFREAAEESLEDVIYYKALPPRPDVVGWGHLRRYLSVEMPKDLDKLRRSGRGKHRISRDVGNAYHQRMKLVLEEKMRNDPRFAQYRDRLTFEKNLPGSKQRNDIRLELPNGKFAIWDLTASSSFGHVSKYAHRGDISHIIEILYFPVRGPKGYPKKLFQ